MSRRSRMMEDLDQDIRDYIERETQDNIERGLPPEKARYAALRKFGNVTRVKEDTWDVWSFLWLEQLLQDIRYGLRMLAKNPSFTAVAILTLALGIGANVAIFSLIDQTVLRSLPVQHPDQLVVVSSTEQKSGRTQADYDLAASFSYPMYKDLRDKNRVFSGLLACFPYVDVNVSWQGHPERSNAELVSGNFFQVLGVRPVLGRVFSQEDETAPGANPVAVLSYGYWTQHFGGDPALLNRTLDINATPFTVVGVTQPGFTGVQHGMAPDLYIPITMKAQITPNWNGLGSVSDYFLAIMGRLQPGMSLTRARVGLQPVFHAILESELPVMPVVPEARKRVLAGRIELTPGARGRPVLQSAWEPLVLVMAMVALVLLIACANLSGLLLARGEARQHETAVRQAMGASRARLVRQLLTEGLILAIAGGAAGLPIGWWTLRSALSAVSPNPALSSLAANLDGRVLAFALAVTSLSALFFGLFPALKASRAVLQASLKEQGTSTSAGAESVRVRKLLVVAQVASTAILLIAAGLFGESLIRLERTNLGMRVGGVVQFSIQPGLSRYSPAQTMALFNRLRQDMTALPGVASASAAEFPLLSNWNTIDTMTFEGHIPGKYGDTTVSVNFIGPHFFSTMGIPLILGREFREGDSSSSPKVAIINEKVAQKFFPGSQPHRNAS